MSEMGKYILLPLLVLLNPFHVNAPFLYPLKRQKTKGFLIFSGGIKMGHWREKG